MPTDEAFDRMFERDKDELREMGIPLETGSNDAWFEDELGYRVDRDRLRRCPRSASSPTSWRSSASPRGSGSRPASPAPRRGRCSSSRPRASSRTSPAWSASSRGSRTSEPAFEPVYAAVRDRRPVSFPYRAAGTGELAERHLEPWGIVSWHGRWYVVGHDRDRDATRVFRLSRVAGAGDADRRAR